LIFSKTTISFFNITFPLIILFLSQFPLFLAAQEEIFWHSSKNKFNSICSSNVIAVNDDSFSNETIQLKLVNLLITKPPGYVFILINLDVLFLFYLEMIYDFPPFITSVGHHLYLIVVWVQF